MKHVHDHLWHRHSVTINQVDTLSYLRHWNNSLQVNMSLHLDTLSYLRATNNVIFDSIWDRTHDLSQVMMTAINTLQFLFVLIGIELYDFKCRPLECDRSCVIKQHRTLVIAVISIVIRFLARNILLLILNNKQQKRKVGTKHVMILYIGSSLLTYG
jgi:hypothetical protein